MLTIALAIDLSQVTFPKYHKDQHVSLEVDQEYPGIFCLAPFDNPWNAFDPFLWHLFFWLGRHWCTLDQSRGLYTDYLRWNWGVFPHTVFVIFCAIELARLEALNFGTMIWSEFFNRSIELVWVTAWNCRSLGGVLLKGYEIAVKEGLHSTMIGIKNR